MANTFARKSSPNASLLKAQRRQQQQVAAETYEAQSEKQTRERIIRSGRRGGPNLFAVTGAGGVKQSTFG